ncbi:MAG: YicC family protein [Desulfobacterales bacterium CG07_land_8_20_14_0_80_52_14]|nr:MAG: YicC family protein [Desulfobacterales bacterium CG23_combo_of_CG06-09_8_20_14_all_52_9]PIU50484.1 MAG: YicC family protein [Desulfobacterales bacterium CG07_land_8_20_14_0_80_52_14]
MVKSMTAFARANRIENLMEITIEIRSYNSRFLDIALRMPHDYLVLEDRIKKEVARWISRGRLEIFLSIQEPSESTVDFQVDHAKARSFYAALAHLKEEFGIPGEVSLDLVANAPGVIQLKAKEKDVEYCWQAVQPCLAEALNDLEVMRTAEGQALRNDFTLRLEQIKGHLTNVERETKDAPAECRLRLEERISALISGEMDLDPGRIAQEAAMIAVKRDITEEITRAKSHLSQFRQITDSPEPAGKKLNFLLQEINREFNTIGAKAENAIVSQVVVEVKSELEKMREQILNIE